LHDGVGALEEKIDAEAGEVCANRDIELQHRELISVLTAAGRASLLEFLYLWMLIDE